jgi:tetratricopeptide (TPR) repeat protein
MMKKILFALLVASGCGGDDGVATDPMSFMPKLPSVDVPYVVDSLNVQPASAPIAQTPVAQTPAMPTQFDDALAQGRALAEKGDRDNAKLMFEAAITLDKKRAEPHVELSRLYIAEGQRGLAIAAAKKGTKLAPLSSQAWNTQGRAELAAYNYDDAIEAFSRACELDQNNIWAWNNLGYTELQLKKYDEAAQHLTEATSRKGAAGYMYNNLGTALEQLGKFDEARLAFESGGKLGSKEAASSRKRLEGVTSVAKADDKPEVKKPEAQTFDHGEEMPDPEIQSGSAANAGSDSDDDSQSDAGE